MTLISKELQSSKELKSFLDAFYKQSDSKPPKENDPYLSFFTNTATLIMGSKEVNGEQEVAELRQNMWTKVTKRHHVVENVASVATNDLLLNGYVEYDLINGKSLKNCWAAHAIFEDDEFQKMKFYQVYLDSAPMIAALSD